MPLDADISGEPFRCNVAMVGLPGVGKTSLVRRYVQSIFTHDYLPTIGVNISKKTVQSGRRAVQFILWDLEGQDDRQELQDTYVDHADSYIVVADVTRDISLDRAFALQARIAELLPDAPFVLAMNKSDLPAEIGKKNLARIDPTWTVVPTSARTGQGVEDVFNVLASQRLEQGNVERPSRWIQKPQEVLEILRLRPSALRVESALPVRVPAGKRHVQVGISLLGGVSSGERPGELLFSQVSCRCPARQDVRCFVEKHETSDRIDAIVELPDDLKEGDEIACEFQIRTNGIPKRTKIPLLIV